MSNAQLSAGELAQARADSAAVLSQTMNVLRRTDSSDARGGQGQVYAVVHTGMRCAIAPGSTRTEAERENAARLGIVSPWMVTVAWDADVLLSDRLVCEGLTLEVMATDKQRRDLMVQRVMAKQVD